MYHLQIGSHNQGIRKCCHFGPLTDISRSNRPNYVNYKLNTLNNPIFWYERRWNGMVPNITKWSGRAHEPTHTDPNSQK
jgi:hypothetical protein